MLSHVPIGHGPVSLAEAGFTLVELMTVITIVAILMAVGVPSYRYVTNNNRVSAEINGLVGDLQYARAEAIKEGLPVIACISTDGASCAGASLNGAWQKGWIVFSDLNGNGAVDAGETVRRQQLAFSSTDTLVESTQTIQSITFNREGYATGVPNGVVITLKDASANTKYTRCLDITLVGQMTVLTQGGTLHTGGTCS